MVPAKGPIPAHLLGNMWAQEWGNIYPLVAPKDADPGFDLTDILKAKDLDAKEMVRYGERFFTSLGFEPLPKTFWERSLFTKPRDREVVCHASAWDIDYVDDLRIKMCIEINEEDFTTIHHELGHNFYQRAYKQAALPLPRQRQRRLPRGHRRHHRALRHARTTWCRSGCSTRSPTASKDIGLLLKTALDKVAFLPFGLLIDQWRWKVFSGEITPGQLQRRWWELREKYQGVAAAGARAARRTSIPARSTTSPRTCPTRATSWPASSSSSSTARCARRRGNGPLNRCSIYGNKERGRAAS